MAEPLAFLNGQLLPASRLSVPVWDTGFVQGVTVAEQLRTFGGQLFRLEHHLDRLERSLHTIGVQLPIARDELQRVAEELVGYNHALLESGDDIGLSMFVTPGPYVAMAPVGASGPTLAMHTYPVAFPGFAAKYATGERLVVSDTRQVPDTCWPASLKCRSRMHYYLADREARAKEPGARALLLDQDGFVSEASTANFILCRRDEGLVSPPREKILPGVSVAVLEELAGQLGLPFVHRDLSVDELWSADEAYLSSTSPCLLPVVAIDGRAIGPGKPADTFRNLMQAWCRLVGLDIVAQAQQFACRSVQPWGTSNDGAAI